MFRTNLPGSSIDILQLTWSGETESLIEGAECIIGNCSQIAGADVVLYGQSEAF
jgi:hypothetical protein